MLHGAMSSYARRRQIIAHLRLMHYAALNRHAAGRESASPSSRTARASLARCVPRNVAHTFEGESPTANGRSRAVKTAWMAVRWSATTQSRRRLTAEKAEKAKK